MFACPGSVGSSVCLSRVPVRQMCVFVFVGCMCMCVCVSEMRVFVFVCGHVCVCVPIFLIRQSGVSMCL